MAGNDQLEEHDCLSKDLPCENGGTCINEGGAVSCKCPGGFIGDACQIGIPV